MKVVITGASGMVGQGVLKECLKSDAISEVVVLVRHPLNEHSKKLVQVIINDFSNETQLKQLENLHHMDACFYCLGVSAGGLNEQEYKDLTHDITMNIAKQLQPNNPNLTFIYVSGAGADSSEQGRMMWARVKGKTENDLQKQGFKQALAFRPGLIQPLDGIKSRTKAYRITYALMSWIFPILKRIAPKSYVTTRQIGKAMINVTKNGYDKNIVEVEDILNLAS